MTKTPFGQRPTHEQVEIVGFIALSLAVVAVAQNDLRRRPADQIRGRKIVWQLLSLNALGALIYLCWGRVRSTEEPRPASDPGDRADEFAQAVSGG